MPNEFCKGLMRGRGVNRGDPSCDPDACAAMPSPPPKCPNGPQSCGCIAAGSIMADTIRSFCDAGGDVNTYFDEFALEETMLGKWLSSSLRCDATRPSATVCPC